MRLIDADALEKDLSKLWEEMDDVDYGEYVRDANKMLNHYPTVEAVPLKPLAKWLAAKSGYGILPLANQENLFNSGKMLCVETVADEWELYLRGLDWRS